MSIVQVALSFAVEIWKFHNIDLFHQGAFQIRSYFKTAGSSPSLIEKPKVWDRSKNAPFPECTKKSFISDADTKLNVPCKAVSKSVLIIYKEESLRMFDVFEQTMHLQMEALTIEELIYRSEIILVVELWFGEKRNEVIEEMKCVCERQLKVHLLASQGLHHHITVIFDYYYLAAVELVVHASLVSISPCYLHLPSSLSSASSQNTPSESDAAFERNVALYQSWASILFGASSNSGRRHTASLVHNHLCQLLLRVIDSLKATFREAQSFLTTEQRSKIDAKLHSQLCPTASKAINWTKFVPNELERLAVILQSQTSEDDIADQASIDITKLSSRIVVLFNEYVKTASFHHSYVEHLSLRTHKLRIKRFSEAFFFQEFPIVHLLAVYDPKYANPMYFSNVVGRGRLAQPTASKRADDVDHGNDDIEHTNEHHHGNNHAHHNGNSAATIGRDNDDDDNDNDDISSVRVSSSDSSLVSSDNNRGVSTSTDVGGAGGPLNVNMSDTCALATRSSATLVRHGSKYNAFVPFSVNSHEVLAAKVRDSAYYKRLPPLPIECPDTDGESHDQPIILEEIFVPEKKRSIIMRMSINSSHSRSSSSDTEASRISSRPVAGDGSSNCANISSGGDRSDSGSIYKKRQRAPVKSPGMSRYDSPSSIPIMRKLNHNFNRKNLPVQDKPVNLVGYRSMDCSAFNDHVHHQQQHQHDDGQGPDSARLSRSSPTSQHDIDKDERPAIRTARIGLGTLSKLDGPVQDLCVRCGGLTGPGTMRVDSVASRMSETGQRLLSTCVACTKLLSCSMPDLSRMGAFSVSSTSLASSLSRSRLPVRKKRGPDKNRYSRFSSIYELEETARPCICQTKEPANCSHMSRSSSNLAAPPDSTSLCTEVSQLDDKDDINSEELTILEMLTATRCQRPVSAYVSSQSTEYGLSDSRLRQERKYLSQSSSELSTLDSAVQPEVVLGEQVTFWQLKARLMAELSPQFQGHVYSEMSNVPASERPYFSLRDVGSTVSTTTTSTATGIGGTESAPTSDGGLHYVVCVHGLDGEHRDLRLVRAYLCLALPEQRFEFLMSESNEQDTFADLDVMKERLVEEILDKLSELREKPRRISFIGHSLGCVLVRAAIASPRLSHLVGKFHAFLSLGGPHLGTVYGSSVLVNVGLWVMQKVRKSACLQQLALRDSPEDLRQTFMYRLSGEPGLEHFRYVLLASSAQDRYVPYHSTRVELCRAAVKDNSEMGVVYMEMVTKILQRLLRSARTTVVRYDASYTLPRSANNYIGRAAHIALIDSELFLEKFICVSAAKYFR